MLSCKELTKVISSDEEMSRLKRMEVRVHLLMCKHCATYVKHLKILQKNFKRLFKKNAETDSDSLKVFEDKIIKKVKSK